MMTYQHPSTVLILGITPFLGCGYAATYSHHSDIYPVRPKEEPQTVEV